MKGNFNWENDCFGFNSSVVACSDCDFSQDEHWIPNMSLGIVVLKRDYVGVFFRIKNDLF